MRSIPTRHSCAEHNISLSLVAVQQFQRTATNGMMAYCHHSYWKNPSFSVVPADGNIVGEKELLVMSIISSIFETFVLSNYGIYSLIPPRFPLAFRYYSVAAGLRNYTSAGFYCIVVDITLCRLWQGVRVEMVTIQ